MKTSINQLTALIFGASGQDGTLLRNSLLKKGYYVIGTTRTINEIHTKISSFSKNFNFVQCNPESFLDVESLINKHNPDKIFLLSAQSSVAYSFEDPTSTNNSILLPIINILEVLKNKNDSIKFFHASSSEVFGNTSQPATSSTDFKPLSPYGAAKAHAADLIRIYRDTYNLNVCNGFLFNHESNLRANNFVTKKIVNYVRNFSLNKNNEKLILGNLDISRDWGLAIEYVEAMNSLLDLDKPHDAIICTGVQMTLLDFINTAFNEFNLDVQDLVETSNDFRRKNDLSSSIGDPLEASKLIDWRAKTVGKDVVKYLIHDYINIDDFPIK